MLQIVTRSKEVENLISEFQNSDRQIGLAVIDLKSLTPEFFGVNSYCYMNPASLSKVFIAAEVLRRIESKRLSLDDTVVVSTPNDIDKDPKAFHGDTRPLLQAGEAVSVDYLLCLMLGRSDNTAANELIDLVGREYINDYIVRRYNWEGSEITRKYLPRDKERLAYQDAPILMGCAKHFAVFMYMVEKGILISQGVSERLRCYMRQFNATNKAGLWLPHRYNDFYRKGGRLDSVTESGKGVHWLHDIGVVLGDRSHYVVALMTLEKNVGAISSFPMSEFAQVLFDYMESYKY